MNLLLSFIFAFNFLFAPTTVNAQFTPDTYNVTRNVPFTITLTTSPMVDTNGNQFRGTVQWFINGRNFASSAIKPSGVTTITTRISVRGTYTLHAKIISGSTYFIVIDEPIGIITVT